MTGTAIRRELAAAGMLAASYPLDWIAERVVRPYQLRFGDPIVLAHGFGGDRANLLALEAYLRMAGFSSLVYFEYPHRQSVPVSIEKFAELVACLDRYRRPLHLIGHSLGGLIAREGARRAEAGAVRSLITLGSPYSHDQHSPLECGIFGSEDPIVPPPRSQRLQSGAFKKLVVIPATGHFGLLYHPPAIQVLLAEIRSNRSRAGLRFSQA